jgi:D-alanine-D-alanine ligase-like ATP-grasp enzyme
MKYSIILFILLLALIIFIFYYINIKLHIFEHYTGLVTNSFINYLKEKKYTIDRNKKVIVKCNNENTDCKEISYKYHFNTYNNILTCNDKFKTNDILRKNKIPVPNSFLIPTITTPRQLTSQLIEYNVPYPLVIKDNNGTFGLNVYTNINNNNEAMDTIKKIGTIRGRALVEEQIEGDCYRIFIFNNKIIDIIKREKPYIIGDGKKKIYELIKIRNKKLVDEKLHPTKNVSETYIKNQGYDINSILEKNKKVYITNIINFHNGASVSRIDIQNVPQKNLKMFIDITYILDIKCIGIDYLSKDINIEYNLNNGKILEVNGTPDTEIHTLLNKDKDIVSKKFFEYIINNI